MDTDADADADSARFAQLFDRHAAELLRFRFRRTADAALAEDLVSVDEVRESTGYFVFYAGRAARPGEELLRDGPSRFRP
jgi:delta 1-pyrroline-5-carboxylate dehydrogenase